jgi:hypothetical protein
MCFPHMLQTYVRLTKSGRTGSTWGQTAVRFATNFGRTMRRGHIKIVSKWRIQGAFDALLTRF